MPVSSEYQSMFPPKLSSRLSSWKRSTYEDFSVSCDTSEMNADCGCSPTSGPWKFAAVIKNAFLLFYQALPYCQPAISAGLAQPSDMYFTAVMERGSGEEAVIPWGILTL